MLILGLISPARFRQRQQIHSGNQSKAITHRPLGEGEGDWQGPESKNEAWSRGMTVALSRVSLDKLWAGSEAPSLGASEPYCSSLIVLAFWATCHGLLLPPMSKTISPCICSGHLLPTSLLVSDAIWLIQILGLRREKKAENSALT